MRYRRQEVDDAINWSVSQYCKLRPSSQLAIAMERQCGPLLAVPINIHTKGSQSLNDGYP